MSFLFLHHKYYLRFCVDSICKQQHIWSNYVEISMSNRRKSHICIIYRGRSILKGTTNCQVTFSEMYSRIKSKLNFKLNFLIDTVSRYLYL